MMLALVLALSAVTTVSATAGEPSGSVTCTDTTYAPAITYEANAGTNFVTDLKLYIGASNSNAGGGDPSCEKTHPSLAASGTHTFTYTAFTMADQTCDGIVLTQDATNIKFEATATLEVTEIFRNKIKRESKFTIKIECSLTREITGIKADGNVEKWTVDRSAVTAATASDVTNTIDFPITIKYYTDDTYGTEMTDTDTNVGAGGGTKKFEPDMGSKLYIQLKEEPTSSVLKFVTNECYFNYGTGSDGKDGNEDVFFTDRCMADTTAANNDFTDVTADGSDPNFDMEVKAFFFTGQEAAEVHLWCEVLVCLQSQSPVTDECTQKTRSTCGMVDKRRRRRDARFGGAKGKNGVIETRIIESGQMILLDKNDIFVPSCGEGFIYDRVTKGCSNRNLVDFIGVYLDIPWNNDYANKSSLAYKNLAVEKAYQLYAMVQMSEAKNHIVGLEVVEARKGSVILTIRVKYSAMSNADAAFEGFVRAIESVDQSRVANILNIRKEKVIEFVEVRPASTGSDQIQYLTVIIIVVVVLFVAVLVSIAAVWKVKMARRAGNSDTQVKAYENPTMVTVN